MLKNCAVIRPFAKLIPICTSTLNVLPLYVIGTVVWKCWELAGTVNHQIAPAELGDPEAAPIEIRS